MSNDWQRHAVMHDRLRFVDETTYLSCEARLHDIPSQHRRGMSEPGKMLTDDFGLVWAIG
jgi:hypothetical protein